MIRDFVSSRKPVHQVMVIAFAFCCGLASLGNPTLLAQPPGVPQKSAYLIGNSLTWDTLPGLLDGEVLWHVDCGKNLQYISQNPSKPCVKTSVPWPEALKNNQFAAICVQPHWGTSLDEDAKIISEWVKAQPGALLVIHTGWSRHKDFVKHYGADCKDQQMTHSPTYFEMLQTRLQDDFPTLEIRSTHAIDVLHDVCQDIEHGDAPLKSLDELYRDDIHVTTGAGRYLMHNLMRLALKQDLSDQGFQVEEPVQIYLHSKLVALQERVVARLTSRR